MKIVYCIAALQHPGGMERVLTDKANYLVEHGYEIKIITTDRRGEKPFYPLSDKVETFDLDINYDENNGSGFWDKLLHYPVKQWKHRRRLKKLLKNIRPDITISMFNNDASFLYKIKDGSKKLLEIHFCRFKRLQYGRGGIWRLADRYRNWKDGFTVRHYERFIVLTEEDKEYWGKLPNIRVIYNLCRLKPEIPASLTEKRAIAVGRLDDQKNFGELFYAWDILCLHYPDWKLYVFGEGPQRAYLENLIEECEWKDQIFLMGAVRDIETEYLKSSFIVMSSRYEGLPTALLEAQACGLPMLAYACKCGPRDIIIEGKTGFLINENKDKDKMVEEMSDRMKKVVGDENLRQRMGLRARENSKRFSEETIMKKWTELFDEVLKE